MMNVSAYVPKPPGDVFRRDIMEEKEIETIKLGTPSDPEELGNKDRQSIHKEWYAKIYHREGLVWKYTIPISEGMDTIRRFEKSIVQENKEAVPIENGDEKLRFDLIEKAECFKMIYVEDANHANPEELLRRRFNRHCEELSNWIEDVNKVIKEHNALYKSKEQRDAKNDIDTGE